MVASENVQDLTISMSIYLIRFRIYFVMILVIKTALIFSNTCCYLLWYLWYGSESKRVSAAYILTSLIVS